LKICSVGLPRYDQLEAGRRDGEAIMIKTLDIQPYDFDTDSIVIEGIRYSGDLFRTFGVHGCPVGSVVRIVERKDGIVWLQEIKDYNDQPKT
jgi:hypothetical protein